MATFTEPVRALEFLVWEADQRFSRERVTIASGSGALVAGRVLGVLANGKYTDYDNTANDGSEVAVAVLAYDVDATAADATATIIARHAVVNAAELGWGANDATGKTAGTADLAAKFILAR